ncbi:hypothetical protein [Thorsellia kenyensis]|uniref:Uncharacterized protein n=1 Tax=Thorsellia kenyensis TaxID=1549888 RepID=A0ABV6C871_9GAMM
MNFDNVDAYDYGHLGLVAGCAVKPIIRRLVCFICDDGRPITSASKSWC